MGPVQVCEGKGGREGGREGRREGGRLEGSSNVSVSHVQLCCIT